MLHRIGINDKAILSARAEYADGSALAAAEPLPAGSTSKVIALTGTFEYDLWRQ